MCWVRSRACASGGSSRGSSATRRPPRSRPRDGAVTGVALPRVAVVTTGGTIDSLGTDPLDLAAYLETGVRLEPGALLAGVAPELARIAVVHEVPFRRLRAHALTDADLADLVELV